MTSKIWYVIGLMSGTSLDGVDLVYVKFKFFKKYTFEILKSETIAYDITWKTKLKDAFTANRNSLEYLDIEYGNYLGKLISNFKTKNNIDKVDFIASHGHTIFHMPAKGYTLQIGNGQYIANSTNIKVVCDFRTQDVDLGGQGAPLVPIGDKLLFSEFDYCLNLGGFANISFEKSGLRFAYDICPINIVLNHYVNQLGFEYDDAGKLASTGVINEELLKELNGLAFYKDKHPKSLGFEWISETILPLTDSFNLKIIDVLRTFVEHAAIQVSNQINKNASILITGGGAFNTFFISRLKKISRAKLIIPTKEIIDYKEALIFAFLGLLKLRNEVNVLSSVTGAKKDHSSGVIFVSKET